MFFGEGRPLIMHPLIRRLCASTAAFALLSFTVSAGAQSPQGATVQSGAVTINRQPGATVVTQSSQRGIIDWRSFSIGASESVRFDQPGRSSVTLNRVTGADASRIDGNLSATGQVWLANPNGVMIGPGGQVNVGGLLATTGRVDAQAFLNTGRALIDQINRDSAVVNGGTVNIAEGGYAALAAAAVRNDGVIAARRGSVALGAGKAMTVDFTGDKLITFQVTAPLDQAPANAEAMIVSSGGITAEGGVVTMSARAAKGVMDNAINLSGHVVASSVRIDGGTVIFGDGGIAKVSGTIDVSNAAGRGGDVTLLGEKVGVMDGARIDASGAAGGGTVLIGGGWQGKGPEHNAAIAYVAPSATINADATGNGAGGKVVVWADDSTRFDGAISARGGNAGGNGGQVETSGKKALNVGLRSVVTTTNRAAGARAGAWLLDPTDISITSAGTSSIIGGIFNPSTNSSVSPATIQTALGAGSVIIQTNGGAGIGSGDITMFGESINYTAVTAGETKTLTLSAFRSIILNGATISLTGGNLSLVLNSGASSTSQTGLIGAISVSNSKIVASGSLAMVGGASGTLAAMGATGILISNSTLTAGASITLRGAGDGAGATVADGVNISLSTLTAGGAVAITGSGGTPSVTSSTPLARGVNLSSSTLSGGAGVTLSGAGGSISGGTAALASGVGVQSSTISSIGSAAIAITGVAGTVSLAGVSTTSLFGVSLGSSSLSAGSGGVTVKGSGGSLTGSGSLNASGVSFFDVSATATGTGVITLDGAAPSITASGDALSNGSGVVVLKSTLTAGGAVTVTGVGPAISGGTIAFSNGVQIGGTPSGTVSYASKITAGGALNVTGTAGAVSAVSQTANTIGAIIITGNYTATGTASFSGTGGAITTPSGAAGLSAFSTGLRFGLGQNVTGAEATTISAGAALSATGVGGAISGARADTNSVGVRIGAATVTGAGGVAITGTGGALTTGGPAYSVGVEMYNADNIMSMVSSGAGGGVAITGTGGAVTLAANGTLFIQGASRGVSFSGAGTIANGGGVMTINGTAGSVTGDGSTTLTASAHGVEIFRPSSTAGLTSTPTVTSNGSLSITGAAGSISGVGGNASATGVRLSGATISATGAATIDGTGGTANSAINGTANGVEIYSAVASTSITASGLLTLSGTGGAVANGNGVGVAIFGGDVSGAGVTITGNGGSGSGTYAFVNGVVINAQFNGTSTVVATVKATGTGDVSITGTGGGLALSGGSTIRSSSTGVQLSGAGIDAGGAVKITGTGGAVSSGVNATAEGVAMFGYFNSGSTPTTITAGAGGVTVDGTGAAVTVATSGTVAAAGGASGVSIGYATLSSPGGVTVTGKAGSVSGGSGRAHGVTGYIDNGGTVSGLGASFSAGGSGAISISGTGGAANNGATGVFMNQAKFSNAGSVKIIGVASSSATGYADGVGLLAPDIAAAGAITLNGTGGGPNGNGLMIDFTSGGGIASAGGNISLTGTRSGAATGADNIRIIGPGTISTTNGRIDVTGDSPIGGTTTSGTANFSHGVNMMGGVTLSVTTGVIRISGFAAAVGTGNHGIRLAGATLKGTGTGAAIALYGTPGAGAGGNGISASAGTTNVISAPNGSIDLSTSGTASLTNAVISAAQLRLLGTGSFRLNNADNAVGTIAAAVGGSISIVNGPTLNLTIGTIFGIGGVTAGGDLTVTQTGSTKDLIIQGPLSGGSVTLASSNLIVGSGMVTATTAPLTVSAVGGSLNATVNEKTGAEAADLTTVASGSINVNGISKTYSAPVSPGPSVTPPVEPSRPSASTTGSAPSTGTVPSVPSVPSVASQSTVASAPSLASVASSPAVAPVKPEPPPVLANTTQPPKPVETEAAAQAVAQVASLVAATLATASANAGGPSSAAKLEEDRKLVADAEKAIVTGARGPGSEPNGGGPTSISAQAISSAVTATASGAFIPPSPPAVPGTGAPLLSTPTVKVDAADTGGANGQVVASGSAIAAEGASGGGGGGSSGGGKSIVPGLAKEAPAARPAVSEPPLAQQPSQMNEEAFLD